MKKKCCPSFWFLYVFIEKCHSALPYAFDNMLHMSNFTIFLCHLIPNSKWLEPIGDFLYLHFDDSRITHVKNHLEGQRNRQCSSWFCVGFQAATIKRNFENTSMKPQKMVCVGRGAKWKVAESMNNAAYSSSPATGSLSVNACIQASLCYTALLY